MWKLQTTYINDQLRCGTLSVPLDWIDEDVIIDDAYALNESTYETWYMPKNLKINIYRTKKIAVFYFNSENHNQIGDYMHETDFFENKNWNVKITMKTNIIGYLALSVRAENKHNGKIIEKKYKGKIDNFTAPLKKIKEDFK